MVFKSIRGFGKKKTGSLKEEQISKSKYHVLNEIITSRRSVRSYQDKSVSDDIIKKIADSVKFTPSAGNYQPWEIIVVKDYDMRKSIVNAAYNQEWMIQAPVFIVACVNDRLAGAVYGARGKMLYGIQALAAAIENMLLTAEALGLGTCWIGAFAEITVARLLECPEYVRPCAVITLGYPKGLTHMPARQTMNDYLHYEKYGESVLENKVRKEKHPSYMKVK